MTVATAPPATYDQAAAALGRDIRIGQRQLVEHGLVQEPGSHLLVKAPTATGKTLAALLIAGFAHQAAAEKAARGDVLRRGEGRTVIATYTRILQDQYDRDLVDARNLFPTMRIAILKGATNYLCRVEARMYEKVGREYAQFAVEEGDPGEARHRPELWKLKADSQAGCGEHDPGECGYAAAKQRARAADVVITNHALVLLGAHNPTTLGPHEKLVIDEIHNFSRAAESFATDEYDLPEMIAEARKNNEMDRADVIAEVMRTLRDDETTDREPSFEELKALAGIENLNRCPELFNWTRHAITHKDRRQQAERIPVIAQHRKSWADGKRLLRATTVDISRIASYALRTEVVHTNAEGEETERYTRAVLMMSATTGTPKHPAYVVERCGLPVRDVELLSVDSALDYPGQMKVSLLEPPKHLGWSEADAVLALIRETEGRTLVLCRSWRSVALIHERLYTEPDLPYRVFMQNRDNPTLNSAVVRRFAEDTDSVLIGTASFFEGIDVPGESLSQVIICQLPMLMTFDPLWKERRERAAGRWFPDHQIPYTALILEQMMGRLIRRTTDRGLVAILDPNAQRTWGYEAATHALASFGITPVARRTAKEWLASQ